MIFIFELLYIFISINYNRNKIRQEYEIKINVEQLNQAKQKKKLLDDYGTNKYLASGRNAYDRIFNNQEKDIVNLIQRLSDESLPSSWKPIVKVEEFTNFILLIQSPADIKEASVNEVVKYLIPIISHAGTYLKNVAVFNRKHQSYLYFDEVALSELSKYQTLSEITINDIRKKGIGFKRYNAVKIDYEEKSGHIYFPVIVSGKECIMLLDTGASMTVISLKLAQKTGNEDLNTVRRKTFSTAKGEMDCPIVERNVIVGSIEKTQEVAVNITSGEEMNLLGVDFFESKNYIIDNDAKSIYIWNK